MTDNRFRGAERAYHANPSDRVAIQRYLSAVLRTGEGGTPLASRLAGELRLAWSGKLLLSPLRTLNHDSGTCELCGVGFQGGDRGFYLSVVRDADSPLRSHSDQGRTAEQLSWNVANEKRRFEDCDCEGQDWTPRGSSKVIRVHTWACSRRRNRKAQGLSAGRYDNWVTLDGVWEHLVHNACARDYGYQAHNVRDVPPPMADPGHRTRGKNNN